MKISDNFTLEEFIQSPTAKANNIDNTPSEQVKNNIIKLVNNILQPIRNEWGKPIKVNSGYRCKALNDKVKGSKTSQHLTGDAADITVGSPQENKKLFHLIVDMCQQNKITYGQLIDEFSFRWLHISNPIKGRKPNQDLHLK
jgi:uncharacterized protein YcbK (DUF882 family)